jgi:hypothetical protein
MYYGWSKEFLEAGKRRLAGDTACAATSALPWNIMPQQTRLGTGRYQCNVGRDGLTTALDLGALRASGARTTNRRNPRERER